MTPNELEQRLEQLSASQVERVRVAAASAEEGLITAEELAVVVTTLLLVGNARGYALGAAVAIARIERVTGVPEILPAPPEPVQHDEEERIRRAVEKILDEAEEARAMRLERIADGEPKQAATRGSGDVVKRSRSVTGWTRGLDSDPCELCTWWWREGRVWQPDHPMPKHPGCTCEQVPVVDVTTTNFQTEKQAAARADERRSA